MTTIRSILVATDFGDPARQAIAVGRGLAKALGAQLALVHVYSELSPWRERRHSTPSEARREAESELEREVLGIRHTGGHVESILETGEPWERIIAVAEARNADLIVMGTHHRRGLSRLMLGSVAEKVLRASPIPVLTTEADVA
jgi:nucleotide-binding universal stress UspA family protein